MFDLTKESMLPWDKCDLLNEVVPLVMRYYNTDALDAMRRVASMFGFLHAATSGNNWFEVWSRLDGTHVVIWRQIEGFVAEYVKTNQQYHDSGLGFDDRIPSSGEWSNR